jgi:hypothetical protein
MSGKLQRLVQMHRISFHEGTRVRVGRPVALEIIEKRWPVERQSMLFEVFQRERKAVVDADERRWLFTKSLDQPLSDTSPRPILPRAGRRNDFLRVGRMVGCVNAQAPKARPGRLCARIVDADVAFEREVHARPLATEWRVSASKLLDQLLH